MTNQQNSSIGSDSSFRDDFIEGAARAYFVMAYADFADECEDGEFARASGGEDWYDVAPATPPNAYAYAGQLWEGLGTLNNGGVYALAVAAEHADGKAPSGEDFGRDFAMQSMGHGISWFDNHKPFAVKVPHIDCGSLSFSDEAYRG